MHKFALFGIILLVAGQTLAETTIPWTKEGCESVKGTWITAHSATDEGCDSIHCNGKNFCRSNVELNWWSGFIWCQSIGRELADVETACPNSFASGFCANLKGNNQWMWLDGVCASGLAYVFRPKTNELLCNSSYTPRSNKAYILCK